MIGLSCKCILCNCTQRDTLCREFLNLGMILPETEIRMFRKIIIYSLLNYFCLNSKPYTTLKCKSLIMKHFYEVCSSIINGV